MKHAVAAKASRSYETSRTLARLIARAERSIGASFVDVVEGLRSTHSLPALAAFIEAGQIEAALAMIEAYAARLADSITSVYVDAGLSTASGLGNRLGVVVSFDQTNARAVRFMAANRVELIREFSDGQRQVVREALMDGIRAGLNPREQARAFRDSLGLTNYQRRVVANYQAELEGLRGSALERALRDGRFDQAVRRAIETETPLSRDQIRRMVSRYRERWVKYRAETIARDQALRMAHAGSDEAIRQAVESGAVDEFRARSTWNATEDGRTRESHVVMDGQERPFGEPFTSGLGNDLRYPGDPAAPLEDVIECRCRASTRVSL